MVFFDEPTAGLDPTNARLVAELIAELRTGVCDTAIVVTHDIEFADLVADQMAILHQGRFADVGSPPRSTARPIPTSASSSRASCGRSSRWRTAAPALAADQDRRLHPGRARRLPRDHLPARRAGALLRAQVRPDRRVRARWAGSSRAPPCGWPACRSAASPTSSCPSEPGGKVRVTLTHRAALRRSHPPRTRRRKIVTQGLLGDKLVEITMGTHRAAAPGAWQSRSRWAVCAEAPRPSPDDRLQTALTGR